MSKVCPCCGTGLCEPVIRCIQCNPKIDLCPGCFSKGKEFGDHKNDHDYEVRQNNFFLLEDGWTASEEVKLLDSLIDLGFGNWTEVAKQLQSKDAEECHKHYIENYVDNPAGLFSSIGRLQDKSQISNWSQGIPFKPSDDPPRPMPMSDSASELAGYMPCRGDFDVEFDNFAETSIKDIEFYDSDDDLITELKFAAVDIFHSRLKERDFRKRIIRKYGLINVAKDSFASYPKHERLIRESLRVFTRIQNAEKSEMFIQAVLMQSNLMKQIKILQGYRRAGLKRKQAADIYKKLYKKRQDSKSKRTLLSEISCHIDTPVSCQMWLQKQLQTSANDKVVMPSVAFPQLSRKPAAPLNINGMPGVEQLTEEEKALCSQIRLPPLQYTSHKNTLIKEGLRLGSLRLQQARPLIKIDVNKTKKLYDFFAEKGWITKNIE